VGMGKSVIESKKASILAWGALLVTVLVTDRIGTDPVNVGKMLLLSIVGFSLIPFIAFPNWRSLLSENSWLLAILVLLVLMFSSMFNSENSFERGLYGAFGRNTGFLSFLSLSILFVTAVQLKTKRSYRLIQKSLIGAGLFNLFYCLASAAGFEIYSWSNPYNAVLGTFGNPNFIGSFMGIISSVLFTQLISSTLSSQARISLGVLWVLTFIVIYLADALQGLLVAIFGISFTVYLYLRTRFQKSLIPNIYFVSLLIVGIVAILGILQKGPLASFLYKPSVSFRGDYWKAGISMGQSNPILGVGVDSYGIYYRTFRSLRATVFPGVDTTTDAAHNVFIDVFAGSGLLAVAAYMFINLFVLAQALRYIKKSTQYDPLFTTLFIAWTCYQLQSIISINQLGLAVWGWTLGGAIIGYTRLQPNEKNSENKTLPKVGQKKVKKEAELLPPATLIKVIASAVVGLLISLPSFVADAKMRGFLQGKGTTEEFFSFAQSWPRDSIRLNKTIVILAQNNRIEEAKLLAAYGTTIFPNDFASWSALYELSPEDSKERLAYKKRLHEIDPFNPKYFEK
jgi:O-antigen ligase